MSGTRLKKREGKSGCVSARKISSLHSAPLHKSGDETDGILKIIVPSLVSTILLLSAFPPINFYPAAWVAPIGWLIVCERREPLGWRGYSAVWLCGCLFWLITLHSIRLAFWALIFGWIAMSLYLAIYLPLFIATTRLLLFGWRVPLIIAAPVAWTGLETIRSTLFTGYAANTLAHSQAFQPLLIQSIDHLGVGGLSFVMMMVAVALWKTVSGLIRGEKRKSVSAFTAGLSLLLAVAAYGTWRLQQADRMLAESKPMLRCLLLQENTPTVFEMNPDMDEYWERSRAAWTSYINLCRQAVQEHGQVDLVVWPESTFTATTSLVQADFPENQVPKDLEREMREYGLSAEDLRRYIEQSQQQFDMKVRIALLAAHGLGAFDELPDEKGVDLLVGCDHVLYSADGTRRYNAAVWIQPASGVVDTYAKMHLVMFGEYIPLRPLLSWLGEWFSFAGVQPGSEPKAFEIGDIRVSPNICFESMMPGLIRWQLKKLREAGENPDLLVNLTNDSWFKGTSMLDHHLASSILCSVESRRPMLVAANTGISAEIDGSGRLLQQSQRMTAEAILAQPHRDGRFGLVQAIGYPLPWLCALISAIVILYGIIGRWSNRPQGAISL